MFSHRSLNYKFTNRCKSINIPVNSRNKSSNYNKLTVDNMNPDFRNLLHKPLRSETHRRAACIQNDLKSGKKYPFDKIIRADITDARAIGIKPLTFVRQVLAIMAYSTLREHPLLPSDAIRRADNLTSYLKSSSIGSYTNKSGIMTIRKHMAEFIERRDGVSSSYKNIFICAGFLGGFINILKLLQCTSKGKPTGILIPIPSNPVYSNVPFVFGNKPIPFHLNEEQNWKVDIKELEIAMINDSHTIIPRALLIINPGVPTGAVLTIENMKEIITFAKEHSLLLIANETYQNNIFCKKTPFRSFKKVLSEMPAPYNELELASIMTIAEAHMNEPAFSCGYVEFENFEPKICKLFEDFLANAGRTPSSPSQAALSLMANPPKENDKSYSHYIKETQLMLSTMKLGAEMLTTAFNSVPGLSCKPLGGGVTVFVKMELPDKILRKAEEQQIEPDEYFTLAFLEATGISLSPGYIFGQRQGTYHFGATVQSRISNIQKMVNSVTQFYQSIRE